MAYEIHEKTAADYQSELSQRFLDVLAIPAGTFKAAAKDGPLDSNLTPEQQVAFAFKAALDVVNLNVRSMQERQSIGEHLLRVYEEIVAAMK